MIESILSLLGPLRHREYWVTRAAALTLTAIGAIGTFGALSTLEAPAKGKLIGGAIGGIIAFCGWIVAREAYFRTGRGLKIGIAYQGHGAPLEDWTYARRQFQKLIESHRIDNRVSMRLFPATVLRSDDVWLRAQERYGCAMLVKATHSTTIDSARPHFKFDFALGRIQRLNEKFMAATAAHMRAIGGRNTKAVTTADLLANGASTLLDCVLLLAGVTCFDRAEYVGAAQHLTVLEERLATSFPPDKNPRQAVRWLCQFALGNKAQLFLDSLPGPSGVEEALAAANDACTRFGDQFPDIYLVATRTAFLANQIHQSRAFAEEAERRIKTEGLVPHVLLNMAVLNLLDGRFDSAAKYFERCLHHPLSTKLNWWELANFADYAMECGHADAIYIQGLYRRLDGTQQLSEELATAVDAWLNADQSRRQLKHIYRNEIPAFRKRRKDGTSAQQSTSNGRGKKRRRKR